MVSLLWSYYDSTMDGLIVALPHGFDAAFLVFPWQLQVIRGVPMSYSRYHHGATGAGSR